MHFRIADTFTDSLARLTGDEQKEVKTTAFDLQLNPANPGMQFLKLDKVYSHTSRAFDKPKSGRIAVKVINHLDDEVMKVFKV